MECFPQFPKYVNLYISLNPKSTINRQIKITKKACICSIFSALAFDYTLCFIKAYINLGGWKWNTNPKTFYSLK